MKKEKKVKNKKATKNEKVTKATKKKSSLDASKMSQDEIKALPYWKRKKLGLTTSKTKVKAVSNSVTPVASSDHTQSELANIKCILEEILRVLQNDGKTAEKKEGIRVTKEEVEKSKSKKEKKQDEEVEDSWDDDKDEDEDKDDDSKEEAGEDDEDDDDDWGDL